MIEPVPFQKMITRRYQVLNILLDNRANSRYALNNSKNCQLDDFGFELVETYFVDELSQALLLGMSLVVVDDLPLPGHSLIV